MILGIFLSSGDSFMDMARYGQDIRFKEFYIKRFAKEFKKVIIFSYANEQVKDLPTNVIIVPNKYHLHRLIYGFLMPFLNASYIKQCDLFRCYHLLGTLPGIMTKLFYNKPFVFNYGYDYREFTVIEKKRFQYFLLTLIHPVANFLAWRIIATSKMVLDWTPRKKTIFIPNGVDHKVFHPLKRKPNKIKQIVSVGRLETQKNYVNMIPALKNLNVKYRIIGKGNSKEQIIDLAKKNKVELEIIEKVPNTQLPKYYNQADIFAQPSLTEGPTKVLLEAMACGLPVMGADVRGIKEVIVDGENGVFCQTDTKSIRQAIVRLLKDKKLREKIGQNARKEMVKNFDMDKLLTQEVELLRGFGHD
jgi:glycosyltransferase involved in cell wall biosynthesis